MASKSEKSTELLEEIKEKFTNHELQFAAKNRVRQKSHVRPHVKLVPGEPGKVLSLGYEPPHIVSHHILSECLASADPFFTQNLLAQIANAAKVRGVHDEGLLNFVVSVIKGVGPRDQLETMLAAQMAAVHIAVMASAQRIADAQIAEDRYYAESALNRLTRAFAIQMEALKRYRSAGEKAITVPGEKNQESDLRGVKGDREKAPPHNGTKHNGSTHSGLNHNSVVSRTKSVEAARAGRVP